MPDSHTERRRKYEECVECCADSIYRVAFRLTSDSAWANDLVQETFLQAWKGLGRVKNMDSLRSWMFAILRNQYAKQLRDRKITETIPASLDPIVPSYHDARNDTRSLVQSALQQLDEKHKMPLLLVSMEGMPVEEVARILELPRGTILSRLHRGREKLKQILERQDAQSVVPEE